MYVMRVYVCMCGFLFSKHSTLNMNPFPFKGEKAKMKLKKDCNNFLSIIW